MLIDNPGLNFHFARIAKAAGLRVLYYIAPQVWAWRPGRMKWIQRRVDHVVVILPFEADLYRRAGVRCTFVGHPLLDSVASQYDRTALRAGYNLDASAPVVGLLPGQPRGGGHHAAADASGDGAAPGGERPENAICPGAGLVN